ncbi:MAG: DUF3737 family protein [Bacteroides sp.]|nr:DUF3737 family protein [Bacillota bacterium]MCM1393944.1 DUF3737 family protein [[Eubacterium] siraeum]MCM1456021.1 DUF3737 family protein [Bacteroides sp.]
MKEIVNQNFPNERDLYGASDVLLKNCTFDGEADGESALKEAKNVELIGCFMNLRYPLWHDEGVKLDSVTMTDKCRAALWYTKGVSAKNCNMLGIKAVRECEDIDIASSKIVSPEFGWKSRRIKLADVDIESEYLFLLSSDITLDRVKFKGKYSFQYVENMLIDSCFLDTKDAFWHTKNVTVRNSVVKGEYLAWYSENLTLENCKIIGTQPLCYCKGLKLVNCEMENTDFSFEYSEVDADIKGDILSVKNPHKGKIVADSVGELILTDDSKYACDCDVILRH